MKIIRTCYRYILLLILVNCSCSLALAENHSQLKVEVYQRAEAFLPKNMDKKVFQLEVKPNWISESQFWYENDSRRGKEFIFVDIDKRLKKPAFDHKKLARLLAKKVSKSVKPEQLPLADLEIDKHGSYVEFSAFGKRWALDLIKNRLKEIKAMGSEIPAGLSPDKQWQAYLQGRNVFVKNLKTREVKQLSTDGIADYEYAIPVINAKEMIKQGTQNPELQLDLFWSEDSRRLMTYKIDKRQAHKLTLVQTVPEDGSKPKAYQYYYPMGGDEQVPVGEIWIFHVDSGKKLKAQLPDIHLLYYGRPWMWWIDHERVGYLVRDRDYRRLRLYEIDANTGQSRMIIDEKSDTFVDYYSHDFEEVNKGEEYLWQSERDGWNHLYRYEGKTGRLLNRVTKGPWRFKSVEFIDEENQLIYFTGNGREADRDPYLIHLYRVNFDGSDLRVLTPEPYYHYVELSPKGKYFIDNYSLINQPPVSVVRSGEDGSVVWRLQQADVKDLLATGYQYPQPFKVKAADNKTDIYGVMYRPSNFDETRSYPIIENIYTGPHTFTAGKSFWKHRNLAQSIAELGFVVVHIDGRGSADRSKEFLSYAYKNLGNVYDDHEVAISQLAKRYSYLDISRVGIYGFSAGGYDAARALFTRPDFYKVAVSASGNHDHRMDKADWNQQWMGYPVGAHYDRDSNFTVAKNLQGKLLIAHGELDENVNPMNTLQLAHYLIKANKDFDMLIVPGGNHVFSLDSPYFNRLRWDYFVRHLMGKEPPSGYGIKTGL